MFIRNLIKQIVFGIGNRVNQTTNYLGTRYFESDNEGKAYEVFYAIKERSGANDDVFSNESLKLLQDEISKIEEPGDNFLKAISELYETCPGCGKNHQFGVQVEQVVDSLLTKVKYTSLAKLDMLVSKSTNEFLKGNVTLAKTKIDEALKLYDESNLSRGDSCEAMLKIRNMQGFFYVDAIGQKVILEEQILYKNKKEELINTMRCAACKMYQHNKPDIALEFEKRCEWLIHEMQKQRSGEEIKTFRDRLITVGLIGRFKTGEMTTDEFVLHCKSVFGGNYQGLKVSNGKFMHLAFIAETLAVLESNALLKSHLRQLKEYFISRSNSVNNICLVNQQILNFNENGKSF